MKKKGLLIVILILIYIGCSYGIYEFIKNTESVDNYLKNNLCFTEKTAATCLNRVKEIAGDEYNIVYQYKPDGCEEYYYVTYKEKDNKPDVEYLYVSKDNPKKVSREYSDYSKTIQYVVSQPTFFILHFILTFIVLVFFILIRWLI